MTCSILLFDPLLDFERSTVDLSDFTAAALVVDLLDFPAAVLLVGFTFLASVFVVVLCLDAEEFDLALLLTFVELDVVALLAGGFLSFFLDFFIGISGGAFAFRTDDPPDFSLALS